MSPIRTGARSRSSLTTPDSEARRPATRDGALFGLGVVIAFVTPPFRDPILLVPILSVGLVLLASRRLSSPTASAWLAPPTWLLPAWVFGVAIAALVWLLGPFFVSQMG